MAVGTNSSAVSAISALLAASRICRWCRTGMTPVPFQLCTVDGAMPSMAATFRVPPSFEMTRFAVFMYERNAQYVRTFKRDFQTDTVRAFRTQWANATKPARA